MYSYSCFYNLNLPDCQLITPLVYDESLSYEQQIAHLFAKLKDLKEYVKSFVPLETFEKFARFVEQDQGRQTEALKKYTDDELYNLRRELIVLIDKITENMDIWDVTQGAFNRNIDSMRNIFNDVTVESLSIDTLNTLDVTVDSLSNSGLNVRGWAVYGGYLMGSAFTPDGVFYK